MSDSGQKVKFALVGCGAISKKHVAALGRLAEAEVVGACDISPEAAHGFQAQHDIPAFTDPAEMIARTDPDVLNVLTPSGLHHRSIMELMHFDRHFVVEKPLALRLDLIDEILQECDQRGLNVFVVQQNRFNPPVRKLKEAITSGRLGKLVLGAIRMRWRRDQAYYDQVSWRGTWAMDGGVLTNQASHHLDMLLWLMGDVESVMAKTATRLADIEAEDTGVVIIKFRNGALGVVEATTATRPDNLEGSISVLGEKGTVEIGGFFMNDLKEWRFAEPKPEDEEVRSQHARVPKEFAWNHTEYFRDVVRSLQAGTKGLVDGLEGRRSVELINAIYESAETGREVFLHYTPRSRLGRSA
jgi:UDP-N-acetyl-2-amino-2-deoxyglucuronate dehydrogenase